MIARARRIRIGVDGRAFSSPAGGVRRYVWELYRAMREADPDAEFVAVGAAPDAPLPDGLSRVGAIGVPTNLGWMAVSLPLAARGASLDVFHAPAYTAPLWGVHPQLLTIHDVSYERRPEWNAYRNDRFRRAFYRRGALAADRVVTDSAFSKIEIMAAYPIPAEQIDVVPLAPAAMFTPGPFDPAAAPPGVRQPYVLHVGDLQVRRNLTTALAAILELRRSNISTFPNSEISTFPISQISKFPNSQISKLVCVGVDRGEGAVLAALAAGASDPPALVLTGPVSDAALLNLYRGASLLVYPSRYEGFGIPILEAMRCGIPVAGADAASIPELIGDAGVLLPPLDTGAWTTAMRSILDDPAAAQRWSRASIARAATFTWARTAEQTLALLRGLAGRTG
jgi:glycosyltransferase involved in cell wall biosynthesis